MNDKGQQTLEAMRQALGGKQSATLVAVTTLLDALAKKGETATLSELCTLVKCDQHLIARALRRANSLGVRPGSLPVTTLPEAFHLLGIDRLRSIVLSSLLAQHAASENHAQREMAIFSLASGLLAQTMAARSGQDAEQAFLCGSLRCYGHLILSTFRPAEFDLARHEARITDNESEAFLNVFGLTPYELTQELLADTCLPEALLTAMVTPPESAPAERLDAPFLNLAFGAVAMSDLMFDPRIEPKVFRERACDVLSRHAPLAAIETEEQLDGFLRVQQEHFAEYARHVDFKDIAERPMISIGQRINDVRIQRSPIVPGRVSHHVQTTPPPAAALPSWQPDTLRPEGLDRIAADLRASHVLLFSLDPFIGAFRLTKGSGNWAIELRSSRLFASGDKNLFGLCVAMKQTLAIHDSGEAAFHSHAPQWMRSASAPAAFFVMPLGGANITQVLLVGWSTARRVLPPSHSSILAYNQGFTAHAA